MATTVRTVIEQALGLSLRNRRDSIANEPTELVLVVQRALMEAFVDAASVYPEYFGVKEVVAYSGTLGAWARPTRALGIYRIENTLDGVEVIVAQDRDREAERFSPSVIERGRAFFPGTSAGSPVAGDLTFFYARSPSTLFVGDIDQNIDSGFPDDFVPLLIYSTAIYLAQKDQRGDEMGTLDQQYQAWKGMWIQHLGQATQNTRHRFAPRAFDSTAPFQTTKPPS